ncbi:membrane protein RL11K [macacine betaherpesvirus 3]|uniref:Rh21 n=1 Tax=Rhesus cytomegalovirus (strain 68-1) TaxID=47929 RepID=Q7TFW0_RHCM6|nr:rh21 [macacine betaherpesvirus 3]AAP50548.1 rh21 [macacine betaherpesvirus 3]QMS44123.1 Rh21 [synthetic construct]QQL10519.1 Rh21 [Rhesus cytomegalovirus strain 68-1.2]QQL10701.1 Rh21 [Rhesus cytomegalovirus strain 68-1_FL]AFL03452.1 Rh21 [macacine betaherpesvirus 3]
MYNFNTAMIVCTLIHKTLSTYIRCNNDFGISNTCTQYNETATVGQNVTLGICIEKYNPVSWHKKTNNKAIIMCQYSDSTNCNPHHDICYHCLSNYSLLLIDVQTNYNGMYYLSYLKDNKYTDLCYNLSINTPTFNVSHTQINRTTVECIFKSNINNVKNKNAHTTVNDARTTNIASYTNDLPNMQHAWLLLPFAITITIVLFWVYMPKKYQSRLNTHREYTRLQY